MPGLSGRTIITLIMTLVLAIPAVARDVLDRTTIERWMQSMEALETWATENNIEDDLYNDDDMLDLDFQRIYRDAVRKYPQVEPIVRRHGFRDGQQWADISARVMQAFLSLEMKEGQGEMDAMMAQALMELERNPNLDPEQREMIRQQLGAGQQLMQGLQADVPEADLRAVESMRPQLRQLMESLDRDNYED